MFIVQADQQQYVGTIEPRHKAWLHRHAMGIFDAGGKAVHSYQIFADLFGDIRQSRPGGDNSN